MTDFRSNPDDEGHGCLGAARVLIVYLLLAAVVAVVFAVRSCR